MLKSCSRTLHGARQQPLIKSRDTFNNPAVYITENGFSQVTERTVDMKDIQRCGFYKDITQEVARALREDSVDVRDYFTWSFLDNFEWAEWFASAYSI